METRRILLFYEIYDKKFCVMCENKIGSVVTVNFFLGVVNKNP